MFLKLLCGLTVCGLALAAPSELETFLQAAKKRVERNRRGLFPASVENSKLDLENYAPLDIVEKSLEKNDNAGDNEVNGTQRLDDKNIEYYHKKNQGTVKTILEEKARDGNKLENVFYHLSYEKTQDPAAESTPGSLADTTVDTTDQTLYDDTTLEPDEETPDKPQYINKISDLFGQDREPLDDATVPSEENMRMDLENPNADQDQNPNDPSQNPNDPAQNPNDPSQNPNDPAQNPNDQAGAGWFNNWFGQGQTSDLANDNDRTTSLPALPDTPVLDSAIYSQQFTILSPFYFGSIGLKSPSCPAHRPTLVSIYFFSFCV